VLTLLCSEIVLRLMPSNLVGASERHISCLTSASHIPESRDAYFDPDDYYTKCDCFAVMDEHPTLKIVPRPHVDGDGYHTNNLHCRYDDDLTSSKEPGEFRIVVTGGSTAWGAGVRQHETFSALLESRLRAAHPHRLARVICAGVGTYSSSQEIGLAREIMDDLKPDVVLMFTGWNDTYFGYRGEQQEEPRESLSRLDPPRYGDFACKLHYVVARAIHNRRYAAQMEQLIEAGSATPDEVVDLQQSNILAMHEIAAKLNARLICCLQPTLYETRKELTSWERRLLEYNDAMYLGFRRYNTKVYKAYRASLPNHAKTHGYEFHDLDSAIADEPLSVFVDHVHFGTRGNLRIAEGLDTIIRHTIDLDGQMAAKDRDMKSKR
ncbi:MAG: SGNH/GDSL hydrolase family protein, partial [Pirellulales bacterium]